VFAGQVQYEYVNGDPTTMTANYLNGFYNNDNSCPQIGTVTTASVGFNPFFHDNGVNSSNVLTISPSTSTFNLGLSQAYTNTLTWTNAWEVPAALSTLLSEAPSLSIIEGVLNATPSEGGSPSPVVLKGCSLSGSEFSQAPTLFEDYNSNQLTALKNVDASINCMRIPLNGLFMIYSSTYPVIDSVTTSITSVVTGSSILASASQLELLDTILYNGLLAGFEYFVLDLHSTDPISDLSNAVYSSGYNGSGWPGGSSGQAYGTYSAQSPAPSYQIGLDFWTLLATKYKDYGNIVLELFNEPQLVDNPNTYQIYELNYWYNSSTSPITLTQNVDGGSYLADTVSQTVAGLGNIISTVQTTVGATNVLIVSGTAFNANFYFLQNTTYVTSTGDQTWCQWLQSLSNVAIGYHFYAQSNSDGTAPGYIGVPVGTDTGAITLWAPTLTTPLTYAPFGDLTSVSTEVTSSVGWTNGFQFLTTGNYNGGPNMCMISTESGTNVNISALYGNDYLAYLYLYSQTYSEGSFHILPWAWYANTICYPSLLIQPYYYNYSTTSCGPDPDSPTSNLIGVADETTSACTATAAQATQNGLFPGYGLYWQNPSTYPNSG
jgi:hypothetical protein